MSTAITPPAQPEIEYPDDDGQPMSENTLQFKWIVLIKEGLESAFRHDPNVFVAGDLLWYPVEGEPKIRQAPDTMVVLGRPKGQRGSYKQWEEGGIAPQVVFEVLSPGNRAAEMARKLRFYEEHGVEEYYIYDPMTGDLQGRMRREGRLEPVRTMREHVSPKLGITFRPGTRPEPDSLVIVGPDGAPFETHQQLLDRAEADRRKAEIDRQRVKAERRKVKIERQRAEAERRNVEVERQRAEVERRNVEVERQRAEAERQRAEAEQRKVEVERQRTEVERQRADRLAARLRELGQEID